MIKDAVGREENQNARVLIWSLRNVQNFVYNSCLFEFEDVIEETNESNVLAPPQYGAVGTFAKRVIEYKTRRTKAVSLSKVNPYLGSSIELHYDYQIYFVVLDFPWYGASVNLLKNWRRRCRFAVCYVIEIWSADIPQMKNFMDFFNQFDLICVGTYHVLDEVQAIAEVPCMFVLPGIDALKFCPDLEGSEEDSRNIDVCSIGRGFPVTNQKLLEKAQEDESFFYYHELTNGSVLRVEDHQAHRTLVSNILKRSRYFVTNYAKANLPELIAGQHEIGYRFFEGAAAGSILIGAPPNAELFDRFFGWEDSIIPTRLNEPDIVDIIEELDTQPKRIEKIRRNNVVNSLLQHDWIYRWEQILDRLGLPTTEEAEARKQKLKQKAEALLPTAVTSSR